MRAKWRPTLGLVIFAVLATVTALPLVGLFLFRLYDNQLIRQTEGELIAQGAVLAANFADAVAAQPDLPLGAAQPDDLRPDPAEPYHPVPSTLDLTRDDLLPSRPDGTSADTPPEPGFMAIGDRLASLAAETQKVTLTGFRILDPQGRVIGGREEVGLSLATIDEVAAALQGRYKSALRLRVPSARQPSTLNSISRGAHVRVFTALPVIVRGRVAGVIYLSRTPNNIAESLYSERRNVALAAFAIFLVTIAIGFVFLRTLTRPIQELIRRTTEIQRGDRDAIRPLNHHGTKEIAHLSESFLNMARSLFDRSDYISTFTAHVSHELKSPLTSIQGAAELLRDNAQRMTEAERNKFLGNIIDDTERLAALVRRLRELAKADNPQLGGRTSLAPVIAKAGKAGPAIAIEATGDLAREIEMSEENATIVLSHLIDNAAQHGATAIRIGISIDTDAADRLRLTVEDNGTGVSERNRARIFDPLFTTRRESGGTGMGLSIVQSMLRAHGGSIRLLPHQPGAAFEISVPMAP